MSRVHGMPRGRTGCVPRPSVSGFDKMCHGKPPFVIQYILDGGDNRWSLTTWKHLFYECKKGFRISEWAATGLQEDCTESARNREEVGSGRMLREGKEKMAIGGCQKCNSIGGGL